MEDNYRAVLLLGVFTGSTTKSPENYFIFTENAKLFDQNLKGAITMYLIADGPFKDGNKIKTLNFNDPTINHFVRNYDQVAVMDLGPLNVPKGLEHSSIKINNIIDSVIFAIRFVFSFFYFILF